MRLRSPSPEHTRRAAGALARALGSEELVLALCGGLGAGKTAFVKGLAEALGIDPDEVTSPTFVIARTLERPEPGAQGPRRLSHVDLYRLETADELEAAGFADLLAPGSLVAVEWADRFPEALPAERLVLSLSRAAPAGQGANPPDPDSERVIEAVAWGSGPRAVLARWREGVVALSDGGLRLETEC